MSACPFCQLKGKTGLLLQCTGLPLQGQYTLHQVLEKLHFYLKEGGWGDRRHWMTLREHRSLFIPQRIHVNEAEKHRVFMWVNTNEFSMCCDVNIYISFEWWMQKTLLPTLDSQSFSSTDLHRLNNASLLDLTIWSDLYSFASFIISYPPVTGCLYFTVLCSTKLNSSCILLTFSKYRHSCEPMHIF